MTTYMFPRTGNLRQFKSRIFQCMASDVHLQRVTQAVAQHVPLP